MPRTRQVSGTVVLASSWASLTCRIRLGVSFGGLPNRTFRCRAIFIPAAQRSISKLRSNSARTARTPTTIFPVAVPVSMLSIRDRKELCAPALDLLHDLQEVKLGSGKAVQAIDGGLIPRPEQVEHPPKLGSVTFGSGRLLAKDVAVVHARLGQGLQLKRPVLIRGGDAGVAEPASHRAKTSVRNVWFFTRA